MRQSIDYRFSVCLKSLLLLFLLAFCTATGAATINLVNGESLTGEIVGENEVSITLKVGTVPVPLLKSEIVSVIDDDGKVRVIDHSQLPQPSPEQIEEETGEESEPVPPAQEEENEESAPSPQPTLEPVEELEQVHEIGSLLPVLLPEGNSYKIDASLLNVRKGPGTDFEKVSALRRGAIVVQLEKQNQWIRVRTPDGLTGWIFDKYAVPMLDEPVVCTGERVNFRKGPGLTHASLRKLSAQEVLLLLERQEDGWVHLRDTEGLTGWTYGKFIAKVADLKDLEPDYLVFEEEAPEIQMTSEPVENSSSGNITLTLSDMDWMHGGKISLLILAAETIPSNWNDLIQGADIVRKYYKIGENAPEWFGLGKEISEGKEAVLLVNLKGKQKNSDWIYEFRYVPQPSRGIEAYLVGQQGAKRAMLYPVDLP